MKIKTKQLRDIFSKLKVGVSQKDIVEQATHITFDGEHAFTFNGNIYVFYPLPTDFKCCVPAKEFMKIVSEISQEEIEITFTEDGGLKLLGKGIKAKLKTIEMDKEFTIDKSPKMSKLPVDFKEAISLCAFSASQDVSTHLNGIYVNHNEVYGSDDYRISLYSMQSELKHTFLLPLSSVLSLKDFDIVEYAIEGSWIYFRDPDKSIFCSRLLDEKLYKDPSEFFEFEGVRVRFPSETKDLVSRASILAKGDFDIDKKISVTIQDGKLTCAGSNDLGDIETYVNIKSNKTIEFVINPQFFYQILEETSFGIVGEDRILFKTDNFKHLMSLH